VCLSFVSSATVIFVSDVSLLHEKYQATPHLFIYSIIRTQLINITFKVNTRARARIGAYLTYFHNTGRTKIFLSVDHSFDRNSFYFVLLPREDN